jgi:hypothetical protein
MEKQLERTEDSRVQRRHIIVNLEIERKLEDQRKDGPSDFESPKRFKLSYLWQSMKKKEMNKTG